jgi:IPT/TIG domain/Bacterial Ig-like domain (group 2)
MRTRSARLRHRFPSLLALSATAAIAACSGSPSEPDTTVASVSVTISTATLTSIGETTQVMAVARNSGGTTVSSGVVTWSVGDGSVASIDPAGLLTALANGSTSVTATASGVSGSAPLVVEQAPAQIEKISGDVQLGEAGMPLDSALVARVLDALSNPIRSVSVQFTAMGGGSVDRPSVTTDALGMAATGWTFGTIAGVQEVLVEAASSSSAQATFTGTAAAGPPIAVSVAGGDAQTELPDYALPSPVTARVTDQFGNGVADVSVRFASGAGAVADTVVVSDLDGLAGTLWTMGATIGAYTASATVDSIAGAATFTAEVVPFDLAFPAGSIIEAGDTITLTGTGFDPSPGQNTVLVDGTPVNIIDGTQSTLSVIVPGFGCVPEKPAEVSVERDSEADAVAAVWYPENVLSLAVGERRTFDSPSDFCLQFLTNATGGDDYLIGVTASEELDAEMSFTMLGNDGVTSPVLPSPLRSEPLQRAVRRLSVEGTLRTWERDNLPRAVATTSSRPSRVPPVSGAALSLKVPDVSADVCADYVPISVTVRSVGTRVALATDDLNPAAEALDAADLAALLSLVDGTLSDVASTYLGGGSDLDGNERLLVVVTQEVNRLGSARGFTTAADLFPVAECESSDMGEIIYVAAPDPAGTAGAPLSKAALLAALPPQLAHEVAHTIQFGRRVAAGAPLPDSWLAEGQAQLVQEASGFELLGDAPGSDYGADVVNGSAASSLWYAPQFEALSYYFGWDGTSAREADAPDRCSAFGFVSASTACVGSYATGASWSLLRYITDRFQAMSPGTLHAALIDEATLDARASLENVLGIPFDDLLVDWAAALYADGQVSANAAPTLQFESWDMADVFGAMPPEQRLTPAEVSFSSFGVARSLIGGGTAYTLLTQPGARGPMAIRFRSSQDQILGSVLGPRLWLVRIR